MTGGLKPYYGIAIALFMAILALCYSQPIARLFDNISIDHNEGWNAFQVSNLLNNKPLYPAYNELVSNNYPPLSFYLSAGLATLPGDALITMRILSLISLFTVAGLLGACIREMGGRGDVALTISLFFLVFIAMVAGHYVGMADPQWLAHAAQLFGLYLLLKSKNMGPLFYLSIVMMVAAGFIKHNLIVLPIAVFLWLLVSDRTAASRFMATGLLATGFFLFTFTMIHGMNFLQGLFLDCREWHLDRILKMVYRRLTPVLAVLMLGTLGCALLPYSGIPILLFFYFILACVWGAFISGGSGVDVNALFDFVIAAALIGSALLRHADRIECRKHSQVSLVPVLVLVVLVTAVAVPLPYKMMKVREFWKTRELRIETVADDIRYLSNAQGPAMCETLALCYWAGKTFEVDSFMTDQKIRAGVISHSKLTTLIESGYFSVIQLEHDGGKSDRFDDIVNRAILDHFHTDRKSAFSGTFLVRNK
ncbi:MAG: glycosyltransferase family 39 protein [Nitrospira sp.]